MFELKQQLKLGQQLIMTPQLQHAIKLLQLSRLELVDAIQHELEENPALEEVLMTSEATNEETPEKEVSMEENFDFDLDLANYFDDYGSGGKVNFETEVKDEIPFDTFMTEKKTLSDHLLWQLAMLSPTPLQKEIGALIIGNLNSAGYLDMQIKEIATFTHATEEQVEETLHALQTFDPLGVCASNLQECLLIQTRHLGIDNTIVSLIIEQHLKNLENKNYKAIARCLKISLKKVITAVDTIKTLDPRPGLRYNTDSSQYIRPDIYVYKIDHDFVIIMNDDGMPKLKISSFYQNAVRNKADQQYKNVQGYMQDKIKSATWLIKSIHQRQKTIYRVMESILKFQHKFFDQGLEYLKPMILKDVAQDIEMHESTVSRVTTNKYVFTPQGLFELKFFFNSSINRFHGEAVASASVHHHIKQIIEGENPQKPYSDEAISKLLVNQNIKIARRTVAKYREMMRILPSNKRKQL